MKQPIENEVVAQLIRVTKIYPGGWAEEAALKNVSFSARRGEIVLLLGPSGSGKTTFLTLLAGMQAPSSGEVHLFGRKVGDYSTAELQRLRAEKIGFIFQSFYLIDSLTALENVMLVLKFAGVDLENAKQRAVNYLKRFGVEHLSKSYPPTFSQGEKQRVAVARALANEAAFIIADEPTGSLATQQGFAIVDFLKESVRKEKRCVVIASRISG